MVKKGFLSLDWQQDQNLNSQAEITSSETSAMLT